jgi:osmotically inducible protein OsmC
VRHMRPGCFNQALANNFGMIELEAAFIDTSVAIEFGDSLAGHPAMISSHITVRAAVAHISEEQFQHVQSVPGQTARYRGR